MQAQEHERRGSSEETTGGGHRGPGALSREEEQALALALRASRELIARVEPVLRALNRLAVGAGASPNGPPESSENLPDQSVPESEEGLSDYVHALQDLDAVGGTGRAPADLIARAEQQIREVRRIGDQARARLVQSQLGFVGYIARGIAAYAARRGGQRGCLCVEDLVQNGRLGLLKAVDRFDPDRDCRLSTYAAWWIRSEIRRAVIGETVALDRTSVSLDAPLGGDGDRYREVADMGRFLRPDRLAGTSERAAAVRALLDCLSSEERELIEHDFDFSCDEGPSHPRTDRATEMPLAKALALQNKALWKLRRAARGLDLGSADAEDALLANESERVDGWGALIGG